MRRKYYSCRFLNPAWHWLGLFSGLVFVAGGLWVMLGSQLPSGVYVWVGYAMVFGVFFVAHCVLLLYSHRVRRNR